MSADEDGWGPLRVEYFAGSAESGGDRAMNCGVMPLVVRRFTRKRTGFVPKVSSIQPARRVRRLECSLKPSSKPILMPVVCVELFEANLQETVSPSQKYDLTIRASGPARSNGFRIDAVAHSGHIHGE